MIQLLTNGMLNQQLDTVPRHHLFFGKCIHTLMVGEIF